VSWGSCLFVLGGESAENHLLTSVIQLNLNRPASQLEWTHAAPMAYPRASFATAVTGGMLYVSGGESINPGAGLNQDLFVEANLTPI